MTIPGPDSASYGNFKYEATEHETVYNFSFVDTAGKKHEFIVTIELGSHAARVEEFATHFFKNYISQIGGSSDGQEAKKLSEMHVGEELVVEQGESAPTVKNGSGVDKTAEYRGLTQAYSVASNILSPSSRTAEPAGGLPTKDDDVGVYARHSDSRGSDSVRGGSLADKSMERDAHGPTDRRAAADASWEEFHEGSDVFPDDGSMRGDGAATHRRRAVDAGWEREAERGALRARPSGRWDGEESVVARRVPAAESHMEQLPEIDLRTKPAYLTEKEPKQKTMALTDELRRIKSDLNDPNKVTKANIDLFFLKRRVDADKKLLKGIHSWDSDYEENMQGMYRKGLPSWTIEGEIDELCRQAGINEKGFKFPQSFTAQDRACLIAMENAFPLKGEKKLFKDLDFNGIELKDTNMFEGADLKEAYFHSSTLEGFSFKEADLRGAYFSESTLKDVSFERADLRGAYFDKSTLEKVSFERADLREANFTLACLKDVDFEKADLRKANLYAAYIMHGSLKDARLQGANLRDANIYETDLKNARFRRGGGRFARDRDATFDNTLFFQDGICSTYIPPNRLSSNGTFPIFPKSPEGAVFSRKFAELLNKEGIATIKSEAIFDEDRRGAIPPSVSIKKKSRAGSEISPRRKSSVTIRPLPPAEAAQIGAARAGGSEVDDDDKTALEESAFDISLEDDELSGLPVALKAIVQFLESWAEQEEIVEDENSIQTRVLQLRNNLKEHLGDVNPVLDRYVELVINQSIDVDELLRLLEIKCIDYEEMVGSGIIGAVKGRIELANIDEESRSPPDLTGLNFEGLNPTEFDELKSSLQGADLSGADLSGRNLSDMPLSGAILMAANLSDADLRSAFLIDADLTGADLIAANLRSADLMGAKLNGAQLSGAQLNEADLSNANLRGADLFGADLSGADLRGADLRDVITDKKTKLSSNQRDLIEAAKLKGEDGGV